MYQILNALKYCHDNKIIHGDIKPMNILIDDNTIKLCDFNCSQYVFNTEKSSNIVTLWYRSPELLLGSRTYGTEIDIWSAGCVLAEMSSSNILFVAKTDTEQLHVIFEKVGGPGEGSELSHLPLFKKDICVNEKKPFAVNKECDDLLSLMLEIEPSKRISASDALAHTYFDEVRDKMTNGCF